MTTATSMDGSISAVSNIDSTYERLSASEKVNRLWNAILSSEYKNPPKYSLTETYGLIHLLLSQSKQYAKENMNISVDRDSDFMPVDRQKIVHTYGSVAQVWFKSLPSSLFSGLFRGADHALLRMSLAIAPTAVIIPGVAIKFLINNRPSRNIQIMHSLSGQIDRNVFAKTLSNQLPDIANPLLLPIRRLFGLVSNEPTKLNLEPLAGITQRGVVVPPGKICFPSRLYFVPNEELKFSFLPHDFRNDLARIDEGTLLYTVHYAVGSQQIPIGKIITKTPFVASVFGDKSLFFRHPIVDAK